MASAATPTPNPNTDERKYITLPSRTDTLPFSDAVLVGDTLFLAGRIGIDPESGKPPAEIEKSKLARTNELESAIITTLPSGPYTAVIHERNGQSGIGLFEVYNLQNP